MKTHAVKACCVKGIRVVSGNKVVKPDSLAFHYEIAFLGAVRKNVCRELMNAGSMPSSR
jgi:hypothetical protein